MDVLGKMLDQECHFCAAYKSWKNAVEFDKRNNDCLYEMVVALVIRTWRKGYKNLASRTTDYRYRGCGYKLNYCPECGRRIAK